MKKLIAAIAICLSLGACSFPADTRHTLETNNPALTVVLLGSADGCKFYYVYTATGANQMNVARCDSTTTSQWEEKVSKNDYETRTAIVTNK